MKHKNNTGTSVLLLKYKDRSIYFIYIYISSSLATRVINLIRETVECPHSSYITYYKYYIQKRLRYSEIKKKMKKKKSLIYC